MVEKYSLGIDPIPHHAWNHSRQRKLTCASRGDLLLPAYDAILSEPYHFSEIAVTPNNQDLRIYQHDKGANDWILFDTLTKHDLRITGIDWAPKTNRIVTCSEVSSFRRILFVIFRRHNLSFSHNSVSLVE